MAGLCEVVDVFPGAVAGGLLPGTVGLAICLFHGFHGNVSPFCLHPWALLFSS